MHSPRYAIYFVPLPDSPLGSFGAAVLGYDCDGARAVARLKLAGLDEGEISRVAAEPARYGFHATLKAPFCMQRSRSAAELFDAVSEFAARTPAVPLGAMRVESLGVFFALRPEKESAALNDLAENCVRTFDGFRLPLGESERERRLAGGLSSRQTELLHRWGYPYVLDEFRFHLTLTGPVSGPRREIWRSALTDAFRRHEVEDATVDSIAVSMQETPAARFRVVHRASLKG